MTHHATDWHDKLLIPFYRKGWISKMKVSVFNAQILPSVSPSYDLTMASTADSPKHCIRHTHLDRTLILSTSSAETKLACLPWH